MLAAALKAAREACAEYSPERRLGAEQAARYVASVLARDNPRFDRKRFLDVVGV